ncbi:hypothetical protein ABI59_06010 [Acidobacteria bacterium Mor1]|nr:hypothetical protein ABI59_06010 [Acidobacteria bacterium Mor1]
MALNENYSFTGEAPADHQSAFTTQFGVHRVLLRPGTRLYKFTEYPLVGSRGITPWWNYHDSTTIQLTDGRPFQVEGFDVAQQRARRLGVSDQAYGRVRSAVTREWNAMTGFLLVSVTTAAYGFFGQNQGMPVDESTQGVKFIGGHYQLYLPNLEPRHLRKV